MRREDVEGPGKVLGGPQGRQEHRTDGPPLPVLFSPIAAGGFDGAAPSPRRRRRSVVEDSIGDSGVRREGVGPTI